MGGNSPHALTNIGRGALQGLEAASNEKRADQAQASTDAYRGYEAQAANVREQETGRHNRADEDTAADRLFASSQEAAARLKSEDARAAESLAQRKQDQDDLNQYRQDQSQARRREHGFSHPASPGPDDNSNSARAVGNAKIPIQRGTRARPAGIQRQRAGRRDGWQAHVRCRAGGQDAWLFRCYRTGSRRSIERRSAPVPGATPQQPAQAAPGAASPALADPLGIR